MLAQRSLGVPVCLRCRLSQARLRFGRAPVLPLAANTTAAAAAASFTSYTRRLRAGDPADTLDVVPPDIRKDLDDTNPFAASVRKVETEVPDEDARIKRKSMFKPLRRVRKGRKVKELSAPLKRQYLGQDSEVLILRDVIEPSKDRRDDAPAEDDSTAAGRRDNIRQELEASIAGQSSVPGQEEVNEQISKLKPMSMEGPHYPTFVTRKELADIRKALKDGYTVAQLRRYASVVEKIQELKELNMEETSEPGFMWKSAWQEGTTPIEKRLPEVDTTVAPIEKLTKMKVVDRIVRGIWEVGVIEENEAIGEIEVRLEPWQLDLLLSISRPTANYTILDNIGHQRRVRIESYRPDGILRFIAERENSEQAITDLERAIRRFQSLSLNLNDFESLRQRRGLQKLSDFFSERDLEVTSRLSGTVLDASLDSQLLIHGTDQTAVEVARRILLSIIDSPSGAETRIVADTEGEGFIQTSTSESALHYRHRRKNYGRWTFPVTRDSIQPRKAPTDASDETEKKHEGYPESQEEQATEADIVETATEAPKLLPESAEPEIQGAKDQLELTKEITNYLTSPANGPSGAPEGTYTATKNNRNTYWGPHSFVELYANYGNVIHKPPPTNNSLTPVSLPGLLNHSGNASRTFLSVVPGFSPLLQYVVASTKFQRHFNDEKYPDSLLFRFSPAPWDLEDPSSLEDFPDLGLRLQVGRDQGRARFQGMGMTIRERNIDVLLPRKAVDMRFVRREVLWTRDALVRSEEIRHYLTMINTNLSGGGAIRAPANLTLRIPAWTINNSDKYNSLPAEETEHGKEFVKEFVFTGVEHRQMVKFDLPDDQHRISYTSVEAGRVGGRRGELRLRLRKPAKNMEELYDQVPELVQGAFDFASLIDDAVHNRLPAPDVKIEKYVHHAPFKRVMPDGRVEEPMLYNTIKEVEDEEVESGEKVEREPHSGGQTEQTTREGDEAVSRVENVDAPLKEGAN